MISTSEIRVELGRELGRVDPKIYGQFLSRRRWVVEDALHQPGHPDAGPDGIRSTVRKAVSELAPPIIRWPGGCTGTSYEWERGIGDPDARSRTVDWHFGYDVSNGFGTAEFVQFCRSVGAEPQINVTTGTGTLREALAWLEYANGAAPSHWAELRRSHGHQEPFDVRYWQIGNEDWGEWEIGRLSATEHAQRCREWARAMHKLTPRVNVLAAGAWRADLAVDWNTALLREAWDDLDYLAVHTYWRFDPDQPDGDYARLVAGPAQDEQAIIAMRGLIDLIGRERGAHRRPQLAFTEWNCANLQHREMAADWRPGRTQYRMLDALVCASFLNVLQRQCDTVGLANFAQTINVVGALMVDQTNVVKEAVYWPLYLQRHHSGSVAVGVRVSVDTLPGDAPAGLPGGVPALDVSATRSPAGDRLWLSAVNLDRDSEQSVDLEIAGATIGSARSWRMGAPDLMARNTVERPNAVCVVGPDSLDTSGPFLLPPASYSVIELQLMPSGSRSP